jgi:hypothetical protein
MTIPDNSVRRLVSVNQYCDIPQCHELLGHIVLIQDSDFCSTCSCQHYHIADKSGDRISADVNEENLVKTNTRPYVISVTDGNGEITETQID